MDEVRVDEPVKRATFELTRFAELICLAHGSEATTDTKVRARHACFALGVITAAFSNGIAQIRLSAIIVEAVDCGENLASSILQEGWTGFIYTHEWRRTEPTAPYQSHR